MAARTGRPYKLQVLSTNGERKLQGSANNPTASPKLLLPGPIFGHCPTDCRLSGASRPIQPEYACTSKALTPHFDLLQEVDSSVV